MRISPDDARLTAYALGELDETERAEIEAALQDNPEACAQLAEISELAGMLTEELAAESEATNEQLSADQREAVVARLDASPPRSDVIDDAKKKKHRPWILRSAPMLAMAASVMLVLGVVLFRKAESPLRDTEAVSVSTTEGPAAAQRPAAAPVGGLREPAVTRSRLRPRPRSTESTARGRRKARRLKVDPGKHVVTTDSTDRTVSIDGKPSGWDTHRRQPRAGILTAASVGDVDRFDNYRDYLRRHWREQQLLKLDMRQRVRVKVVDQKWKPVNDAAIVLDHSGVRAKGRTHADGRWDFFPAGGQQLSGSASVTVTVNQQRVRRRVPLPEQLVSHPVVIQLPFEVQQPQRSLDLAFLIDVTGSMSDELRYVNREIVNIVARVRRSVQNTSVRVGGVFYRDRTDQTPLQKLAFSKNVGSFARAMTSIQASGGGDYPEDLNAGLQAALRELRWREGNVVRVLVVIADAPPQRYRDAQYTYHDAMSEASARGIRLLPVAASGADRVVEYLFRAMGARTSTPYVYLTDDSGVGNAHMEADTDRVAVEKFNQLLTRLIISDLRGQGMHEPGAFGPQ